MTHEREQFAVALQEIFTAVGYAVWQAQVLELAVAYHLVLVYGDSDEIAGAKAAQAFSSAEKKTLGSALTSLKKLGPRDPDLLRELGAFREERNWLVHHSRHDFPTAARNASTRGRLLARLGVVGATAAPLAKRVQDATDDHLIFSGLRTREELTTAAQRLLDSWRKPDGK